MVFRVAMSEQDRVAIEEELQAKLDEYDAAGNRADPAGTAGHFSDRCSLGFIHTGTYFPTVATVLEWMSAAFETLRSQRHDADALRIAILAPDVAVMTWHGMVSGTNTDGTAWSLPFGRTFVCVKVDDEWEFVHVHVSYVPQQ